jgi:hypothetical protein
MRSNGAVRFGLHRRLAHGYERRMTRNLLRIAFMAAVAVLVAGLPQDALAKKKKKGKVKATIGAKVVKLNRYVHIAGGGGTIAFQVLAQTKPRGQFYTLGVACGQFPPATVPGDLQFCSASLQDTRTKGGYSSKIWMNLPGDSSVTIDSYDGQQIAGRFSGDLDSLSGDPPIRIEGEFRGPIVTAAQ